MPCYLGNKQGTGFFLKTVPIIVGWKATPRLDLRPSYGDTRARLKLFPGDADDDTGAGNSKAKARPNYRLLLLQQDKVEVDSKSNRAKAKVEKKKAGADQRAD